MPISDEALAERARLDRDIALASTVGLAELDDLRLRLLDVVEQVEFSLEESLHREQTEPPTVENLAWRCRARHALEKYKLALRQVERRHQHMNSKEAQKI